MIDGFGTGTTGPTQPCRQNQACVPRTYQGERTLSIHQLPKKWQDFEVANREFFNDLGAPGGAAELCQIPNDADIVRSAPARD